MLLNGVVVSVPKGMQNLNATEIEGKEAQKSFLRGCRARLKSRS